MGGSACNKPGLGSKIKRKARKERVFLGDKRGIEVLKCKVRTCKAVEDLYAHSDSDSEESRLH